MTNADWTPDPPDPRTVHLARALWAEFDYLLPADPNTIAALCVAVLAAYDAGAAGGET